MKRIQELRQTKKISQKKLAEIINSSQSAINSYENDIHHPDIVTLKAIADFFEVSVDYLLERTEIKNPIETVTPYDLNEDELEYIECYRLLPKPLRSELKSLTKSFLNYIEK